MGRAVAVSVTRRGHRAVLVAGLGMGQQAVGRKEDYRVLLGPVGIAPGAVPPVSPHTHVTNSHIINSTPWKTR